MNTTEEDDTNVGSPSPTLQLTETLSHCPVILLLISEFADSRLFFFSLGVLEVHVKFTPRPLLPVT